MPNYFSKFPKINYTFKYLDKNNNPVVKTKEITNIHIKFQFSGSTIEKSGVKYPFQLRDHDRPDSLAEKYYKSPDLYWMVLFSDFRYDAFNEMPKSESIFFDYLSKKYDSAARTFFYLTSLIAVSPESIQTYVETVYNITPTSILILESLLKNIDTNPEIDISDINKYETVLKDIRLNSIAIISQYRQPTSTEPSTLSPELLAWIDNAITFIDDLKELRQKSLVKASFPSAFRINLNDDYTAALEDYNNFEVQFLKKYPVTSEEVVRYCASQVHSFYDNEGLEVDPFTYVDNGYTKTKTIYEYEEELNELSRSSFLIDSRYSKQVKDELEDAFNQVIKDFE